MASQRNFRRFPARRRGVVQGGGGDGGTAAYGVITADYGRVQYVVAGGHWAEVDALEDSDYPAVRVNPDGSINPEHVAEATRYWTLCRTAYAAIHRGEPEFWGGHE